MDPLREQFEAPLPSFLDFFEGSFLFDPKEIERNYKGVSSDQFIVEVMRYINVQIQELTNYATVEHGALWARLEANRHEANQRRAIRNLALYADRVCLDDPICQTIFLKLRSPEISIGVEGFVQPSAPAPQNPDPATSEPPGRIVTNEDHPIAQDIAKYAGMMLRIKPAIQAGFIRFLPFDQMKIVKPVPQITIPMGLKRWMEQRAKVYSVSLAENQVRVIGEGLQENLAGVQLDFEGYEAPSFSIRIMGERIFVSGPSGEQSPMLRPTVPVAAFQEEMASYIEDFVGETAMRLLLERERAAAVRLKYVANSSFTSAFYSQLYGGLQPSISHQTTDSLMNLELPIIEDASINDILRIRQQQGESFQNFRVELEAKLRELATITDESQLQSKMRNVSHELQAVQLRNIRTAVNTLKSNLRSDILLNVATLGVGMFVPGAAPLGLAALSLTIAKATKTVYDNQAKIRENPCYFLWKLTSQGRSSPYV